MRMVSAAVLVLAAVADGATDGAIAQGCGPTRLKVLETVTLDIPPARAWSLVGSFQDMSWARTTRSTVGAGGNEPDKAVRSVTLDNGAVLQESLYKYNAATMSYSYHVDKVDVAFLPVQNVSATLEVVPAEDGRKSVVRWRAAFYRTLQKDEPAPDVADARASSAITALLHRALDGLKARVEAKT